jgi:hypothetical protein
MAPANRLQPRDDVGDAAYGGAETIASPDAYSRLPICWWGPCLPAGVWSSAVPPSRHPARRLFNPVAPGNCDPVFVSHILQAVLFCDVGAVVLRLDGI